MRHIPCFLYLFCSIAPLGAIGIQDLTITSVSYQAVPFFQTIPLPGKDGPYAISNSGVALGSYQGGRGTNYESGLFTYDGSTLTTFAYPSSSGYLLPTGINNSGVVTLSGSGAPVSFMGKPGAFTPVAFPGAKATDLNGINDAGVAVGGYTDSAGIEHGFIYKPDGTYTTFGPAGNSLIGINNQGNIVGGGFLFINGSFDSLDGTIGDAPTSINDKDQIFFPLAYHGSDILDYDTRTLEILSGGYSGIDEYFSKINSSGIITGRFSGDLVIPTPEPATFLLMLAALPGAAFLMKRRRAKQPE